MDCLKLFASIAPFITEKIYQNLKKEFKLEEESIHHFKWPKYDEKLINKELENEMDTISDVVQVILSLREKIQMGVRWPLQEVLIGTGDEKTINAVKKLKNIILKQTNIKDLKVQLSFEDITEDFKADYSKLGPDFGKKTPQVIAKINSDRFFL